MKKIFVQSAILLITCCCIFSCAVVSSEKPLLAGTQSDPQLLTDSSELAANPSTSPKSILSENKPDPTGTVTAQLQASRVRGVAPLAVFFDASASTGVKDSFHNLGFKWSFGDPEAGNYATNGKSRNTSDGPLAAHVFNRAGTYNVSVTVTDSAGHSAIRSQLVVVDAPDTIFAGKKTSCFSQRGNFTGCPGGAEQVTTGSGLNAMINRTKSGKRLLLRCDETWVATKIWQLNTPGPGLIGSFGGCGKATIEKKHDKELFRLSGKNPKLSNWRLVDLTLDGKGTKGTAFLAGGLLKQLLVLRVDLQNIGTYRNGDGFNISYHLPQWYKQTGVHDEVAIVDTTLDKIGMHPMYVAAERLMLLGVTSQNATSHTLRTPQIKKAVIDSANLGPGGRYWGANQKEGWNETFKLMGNSEEIVVTHSTFSAGYCNWSVTLGPMNAKTNTVVKNAIFDTNRFIAGPGSVVIMPIFAQKVSVRNNVFDMRQKPGAKTIMAEHARGVEPPPRDIWRTNNQVIK